MKDKDHSKVKKNICKVIIGGEEGVGIREILKRIYRNQHIYDWYDGKEINVNTSFIDSTIEYDELFGKKVKLGIWDTVSSRDLEKYNIMLFRDASAAILVYDITNKISFDEIKNYWHNLVKDYTPQDISKQIIYYNTNI